MLLTYYHKKRKTAGILKDAVNPNILANKIL